MKKSATLVLVALLLSGSACKTPAEVDSEATAQSEGGLETLPDSRPVQLGCAEDEQTIFDCTFGDPERGVSICARASRLTMTAIVSDTESHQVHFSPQTSSPIDVCEYVDSHSMATRRTFTDGGREFDVYSAHFSGPDEPAENSYSLRISTVGQDASSAHYCRGEVVDSLRRLGDFYEVRDIDGDC